MGNRILITGATGFLGRQLVKRLMMYKEMVYLTASHDLKNLNIHKANLTNLDELKKLIKEVKPTIVYHLGALVDLSRDFKVAQRCIEINIKGTLNLLEALNRYPPKLFIFLSTEEVYGQGTIPYQENQLVSPPSAYAISKVAGEHLTSIYAQELGFYSLILRVGTMYGPENSLSRFISQIILRALKNEDIAINSGKKKRDYIYVDDVVDALIAAKDAKLKDLTTIINLGGGRSYQLLDVVKKIIKKAKSKSKIMLGVLPDRSGEADMWLLDNSKARALLSWRPKTSLEKGLKQTVSYFKREMVYSGI